MTHPWLPPLKSPAPPISHHRTVMAYPTTAPRPVRPVEPSRITWRTEPPWWLPSLNIETEWAAWLRHEPRTGRNALGVALVIVAGVVCQIVFWTNAGGAM